MAAMIEKATGTAPKGAALDEGVDDLVWDDELEVGGADPVSGPT